MEASNPLRAIARVGSLPFQLLGGGTYGSARAIYNEAPVNFGSVTKATMYSRAREFMNKHVGEGMTNITESGIIGKIANIGKKGGFGEILETLIKSSLEGGVGTKGLALLGGYAALAVAGVVLGFKVLTTSYHKLSQSMKGFQVDDETRNPLMHGASAASGLAMMVGGVMSCIPGAGVFGAPLALAGLATYVGTGLVKWFLYGANMFNYPKDYALWPLNKVFDRSSMDYRRMM